MNSVLWVTQNCNKFILKLTVCVSGRGVSKRTWASSNPVKCFDWFTKYLPVEQEGTSCHNHQCECAVQVLCATVTISFEVKHKSSL